MASTSTKVFFARAARIPDLRAWVRARVAPYDRADDVEQVASELATNVIFHTDSPLVVVSVTADDAEIRLRVTDHGSAPLSDDDERARTADLGLPSRDGGLGLGLVQVCADTWGVRESTPAGHMVWATFARPPQPAQAAAQHDEQPVTARASRLPAPHAAPAT